MVNGGSEKCVSMAALMVLQKPMLAVYPPATLTAWYYAVGSALTMVLCACLGVRPKDFLLTGNWEVTMTELIRNPPDGVKRAL